MLLLSTAYCMLFVFLYKTKDVGEAKHSTIPIMNDKIFLMGAAAMAATLAISNYLVLIPLGAWLTYGAFTYPISFLVTDCVNRAAGARCARRVVAAGFCVGVPLSFLVNAGTGDDAMWTAFRVAAASGTAFAVSQLLDVAIFDRLRRAVWWLPPAASSGPASVTDTVLFFALAFGGSGLPWLTWAAGDFAVKVVMVLALLPLYRLATMRLAVAR